MTLRLTLMVYVLCISTTLFSQKQQQFGGISYPDALNLTTKQMMLSQQMAKAVVLGKLGGKGANISQQLTASRTLFDRNMAILKVNANNQTINVKTHMKKVFEEWKKFKTTIGKPVEDIASFIQSSEALLVACSQLTIATKESAMENGAQFAFYRGFKPRLRAINKTGRIRMLSQKMCLNYAACRLSKDYRGLKSTCNRYRFNFNQMDKLVKELLMFKINTPKSDQHLAGVLYALQKLESNKIKFEENEISMLKIITITNDLLKNASALAKVYSTPPRRLN